MEHYCIGRSSAFYDLPIPIYEVKKNCLLSLGKGDFLTI